MNFFRTANLRRLTVLLIAALALPAARPSASGRAEPAADQVSPAEAAAEALDAGEQDDRVPDGAGERVEEPSDLEEAAALEALDEKELDEPDSELREPGQPEPEVQEPGEKPEQEGDKEALELERESEQEFKEIEAEEKEAAAPSERGVEDKGDKIEQADPGLED